MKLIKIQIKNYCSIVDSGVIELSRRDNVTVFAGQNESGKSSVLRALYDFEKGVFNPSSMPFSTNQNPPQIVSCTYAVEECDNILESLTDDILDTYKIEGDEKIFDEDKIKRIKEFTLTRTNDNGETVITIDSGSFKIFQNSILENFEKEEIVEDEEKVKDKESVISEVAEKNKEDVVEISKKFINITDEQNSDIAKLFWQIAPKIVFFDDFCDLLPDKIFISALKNEENEVEGYRAVKNLEQILGTNFVEKDTEIDSVRRTKEDEENENLSVDFQNDWGQRIHGENQVVVKYDFQKRDGEGKDGSYINFYVETKKGQPLPPKQRSKGLIWFLSLWLELKAQDIEHNDLVLLLDEPDQHLHVKAQKDILKLINKLSGEDKDGFDKGDQVFYSTHSPYLIEIDFLNRIKLVLNTEKDGTKIEDVTITKIDTEYKKDALQPISNAIGFNISEFSPLNNKNVILEGVSDYYYFLGMKKLLNRADNYSFVPGIGVRQINTLISFSIGYGLDWIVIIDDDPKKGGKDSKNKFDEIKDCIFDGNKEKTEEKIYILKNIVGIENIFTIDDIKLIDSSVKTNKDKVKVVGKKRKVLFSKLFFEKIEKGEIKKDDISKKAQDNFNKVFNFIEDNFVNKKGSI